MATFPPLYAHIEEAVYVHVLAIFGVCVCLGGCMGGGITGLIQRGVQALQGV